MKNIDFKKLKILSDNEFWRRTGNELKLSLRELPKALFIRHSHVVDMISVALVLVLAGYLVLALFYFVPTDVDTGAGEQQRLTADLLDRLGLWIDERGQEKQRLLELSGDRLFERQKIIE